MIGFVKVVRCSFDRNTWYYDLIGQVFFVPYSEGDFCVIYTPFFEIGRPLIEDKLGPDIAPIVLYVHKSDVIPWLV